MKFPFAVFALIVALLAPSASAAPLKYAGTWLLNREKSQGLTETMAGSEVTLLVSQDEKKIYVEQKMRLRGRIQPSQELAWNLDGAESSIDVSRPMAGAMRLKARWVDALQTLELYSSITGDDQGTPVAVVTKETWELLQNGKALRITRTRTSPQGKQTFTLYFEKQEK